MARRGARAYALSGESEYDVNARHGGFRPPRIQNSGGHDTMKAQHFVLTPDRRAPALHVVGTDVVVLASNDTTQSFGITYQQGDEGTGPPPHSHDWDESFYVLGGAIEF